MDGSVPLSFPAVLLNTGQRKAPAPPLSGGLSHTSHQHKHLAHADTLTSRRSRRRYENQHFLHLPGVQRPSAVDLYPRPPIGKPTFSPTPKAFTGNNASVTLAEGKASALPPTPPPSPLDAGRFSLSLKGVRKNLRPALSDPSSPTANFLQLVESQLRSWLLASHASQFFSSTSLAAHPLFPNEPEIEIVELARLPHTLRWVVTGAFERFLVHALARYYFLGSFSVPRPGGVEGEKVTHIVRQAWTKPITSASGGVVGVGGVGAGMDTPPVTDVSASEGEDGASEWDDSEIEDAEIVEDESALPTETEERGRGFVLVSSASPSAVPFGTSTPVRGGGRNVPARDVSPSESRSRSPPGMDRTPRATHGVGGPRGSLGGAGGKATQQRGKEWSMPDKTFWQFLTV